MGDPKDESPPTPSRSAPDVGMIFEPPPPPAQDSVQAAIAAGARVGESLTSVRRKMAEASGALLKALEDIDRLGKELDQAKLQLTGRATHQAKHDKRLVALEKELEEQRLATAQAREESERERQTAARERARLLEEHDEFIAGLLEEQEAESGHAQAPPEDTPPLSSPSAADSPKVVELKRQLQHAQERIDKLTAERERSREVLRRLQKQRDEAQETVNRLARKAQEGPEMWAATTKANSQPQRTERGLSEAEPAADPAPPIQPPAGQSPLAAALANTDPTRRKR